MSVQYFDRQGNEIDMREFSVLVATPGYHRVQRDVFSIAVASTIWTGFDAEWEADWKLGQLEDGAVPMIFESVLMINGERHAAVRTATEADALKAHEVFREIAETLGKLYPNVTPIRRYP